MILEDGNDIYLIFYFSHIFKKSTLENLVELNSIQLPTLNFHAQLEINGIVHIIKK